MRVVLTPGQRPDSPQLEPVLEAMAVPRPCGRGRPGVDVGDSEDGAFWTASPRPLQARGLPGVPLGSCDAHTGLKAAIGAVMAGAAWQRCRGHFLRNVLARVPSGAAEMVAAAIRTSFAQPTGPRSASRSARSPPCGRPRSRP
jgi:putative transposase